MRTALIAFGLVAALPAQAAERIIPLKPSEPYRHVPSGLQIPSELDGIVRKQAASYADDQLDDAVQFESPDGAEMLTVYIFRNVTGSVPVWFDRIGSQIRQRDGDYGEVTAVEASAPFTPPHQANASALMQSFITGKGPFRGTGAALIPLGRDWYVALRYSSRTLSAAAIGEHLLRVPTAMGWPEAIASRPAAELIAPCTVPLPVAAKAKPVPSDGAAVLALSAALSLANDDEKEKKEPAPPRVRWCRDSASVTGNAAVYRALDDTGSYLIALGDAGRGIWVAPDTLGPLIEKSKKPRWGVTLVEMTQSFVYPAFDGLPAPDQAATSVQHGNALAGVSTWGPEKTINIATEILKK